LYPVFRGEQRHRLWRRRGRNKLIETARETIAPDRPAAARSANATDLMATANIEAAGEVFCECIHRRDTDKSLLPRAVGPRRDRSGACGIG
jgi:hypothetical protein